MEWHAARASRLGGSEIAAVVGLSPWQSKFSLWHFKHGDLQPEGLSSPSLEWGHRLEPVVADKFADNHPEFSMVATGTWVSKQRGWQLANPDRMLFNPTTTEWLIYEGKTADKMDAHEWGDPGSDQVPVYYRCQALWYLDTFQLPAAHFGVLIGGNDYREYILPYHRDEAMFLRDAGAEFMRTVTDGERPVIDDSASTYHTVKELNPALDGDEVPVDEDDALTYVQACTNHKISEAAKRHASAVLIDQMGSATYATLNGQKIAMRVSVKGGTPFLRPAPKPAKPKEIAA